ncbi:hypothetical protein D3C76_1002510 [compost metagenome]
MLNESSTVTACGPSACWSMSVRPKHGSINASLPWIRWLRLSLVLICTVNSQLRRASAVRALSGVACAKLPPRPMNTLASPLSMA